MPGSCRDDGGLLIRDRWGDSWFDERKGLATGIVGKSIKSCAGRGRGDRSADFDYHSVAGSSLGSIVWPLMIANLPQRGESVTRRPSIAKTYVELIRRS